MAKAGIYTSDVNCCTLVITQRLGLEDDGAMVGVGLVHYNTVEEINKLGKALRRVAASDD